MDMELVLAPGGPGIHGQADQRIGHRLADRPRHDLAFFPPEGPAVGARAGPDARVFHARNGVIGNYEVVRGADGVLVEHEAPVAVNHGAIGMARRAGREATRLHVAPETIAGEAATGIRRPHDLRAGDDRNAGRDDRDEQASHRKTPGYG
ncbi:hypothetical protein D3C81_1467380 [compost metagenome]